jgi:hypothetical protein
LYDYKFNLKLFILSVVRLQVVQDEQEDARHGHQLRRSVHSRPPVLHDHLPRAQIGKYFRPGTQVSFTGLKKNKF